MRHVHLVGSVPLASAQDVFATVSAALGDRLKRIPDGETGDRGDWITWLEPAFANNPALEKSDELFRIHATGTARIRYRLKSGKTVSDVSFGNLFYADIARQSYGDSNHKHVVEPDDMGDMVAVANRLSADIKRPINLIHMPVPRDRADDAYFAPLARWRLKPETELCLGLVHYSDGVAGTRQRLAVAERHAARFSIATECGFGRRDPATIPELLRIHAETAA